MVNFKPSVDAKLRPPGSHNLLLLATAGALGLIAYGCYAYVSEKRYFVPLAIGVGLLAAVFVAWFRSQRAVDLGGATPTVIEANQHGVKITLDARTAGDRTSIELLHEALKGAKRHEITPPDGSVGGGQPPASKALQDKSQSSASPSSVADDVDDDQRPQMTARSKVIPLNPRQPKR